MNRSDAHGAGGCIATARGNRYSRRKSKRRCCFLRQLPRDLGALQQARQPRRVRRRDGTKTVGPGSVRLVQPHGACGIGHVGCQFAGQPETDEILGQQDVANSGIGIRLVFLHPEYLWRGHAGHCRNTADRAYFRHPGFHGLALRHRASVIPENCRAQDFKLAAEHDGSVHLSGQPDGPGRCPCIRFSRAEFGASSQRGFPPCFWLLFAPVAARSLQGERGRRTCQLPAFRRNDDHLDG